MKKKILTVSIVIAVIYFIVIPLIIAIAHGLVMRKYTYKVYDSSRFLLYEDIADQYPRELIPIQSGKNTLSAYLYGKNNIVVAPGHDDSNDIKLYEIRYFTDAGYQVLCLRHQKGIKPFFGLLLNPCVNVTSSIFSSLMATI